MLALALEPYPNLLLSDFEASRGGTTYTIETLRHVRANHPEERDPPRPRLRLARQIETWRAWREILAEHRLSSSTARDSTREALCRALPKDVAERLAPEGARPGGDVREHSIFWAGNAPVTISSTWIRRAIPAGENLSESLPENVAAYLRKHGLYRLP